MRAVRNGEIDLALGLTLLVDDQVDQIVVRNEQLMLALEVMEVDRKSPAALPNVPPLAVVWK